MKTKFTKIGISLILFLGILISFAFKLNNCDGYYAMKKGTKSEFSVYDANNNLITKSTSEVIDSKTTGGKTISTIKTISTNLKKNKITESQVDVECDGNAVTINTLKVLEENLKKSNQLSQSTASGNNPVFPNVMSVGQTLPEANINISVKGEINLETNVRIYDRKVVAMEKITVPAGTFDCAVITYTEDTKILFDKLKSYKTWYAKGVGIVKNEEYDKKGKLESRSELTSFTK